jgi:hypothetical protein
MGIKKLLCLALSVSAIFGGSVPISANTVEGTPISLQEPSPEHRSSNKIVSVEEAQIGDFVMINGEKYQMVGSETIFDAKSIAESPVQTDEKASYSIKNVKFLGDMPTAEIIATAQAQPGLPLSLSVSQTRTSTVSCSVSVGSSIIKGTLGFTSGQKFTVKGSTKVKSVPKTFKGKTITLGALTAQCVYKHYNFDVYSGSKKVTTGNARKPIGCKFNYYLKTDDGMTLWP